jgi:GTP diphosphokinase / guanosine-3',5'-bis(diphosphate) 3'-diphosphatase
LADYTREQHEFLTHSVQILQKLLPEKYQNSVVYRVKKPYSIYRKMQQYDTQNLRDIYDVFAMRIIVDSIADCYHVLGIIHGAFTPMPGRFKDFIAVPKLNGYRSLHTTVLGLYGTWKPTEIQIRTSTMDQDAEHGTAAHIYYKMHGDAAKKDHAYWDFVHISLDAPGISGEEPYLGKKIGAHTVFVFTPKGDVKELPKHATPVDFAYAIHSDVGHKTVGARVNGRIVTLDTELCDGDIVDIITSATGHPAASWLDFVVSSKARSHIDIEVKRLSGEREQIIERGKEILRETFKQSGIDLGNRFERLGEFTGERLSPKKLEELLYHIGQGIYKASSLLPRQKNPKKNSTHTVKVLESSLQPSPGVIIWGAKRITHQMAQCCRPHYPENIVAVLRSGW